MDNHDQQPIDNRSSLNSAEYRAKLLTKLNCLIAVLEVAITKISRSMDLPGANEERLLKIKSNLENTLSICHRAKSTLERNPKGRRSRRPADSAAGKMSYRDYVELSSIQEYRKFKKLDPIRSEELADVDIEQLVARLMDL